MEPDQISSHSLSAPNSSPGPPGDNKKSQNIFIRILKLLGLIFLGFALVMSVYLYHFYKVYKQNYEDVRKSYENYEKYRKAYKEAQEKPHKEMMAKIEDIHLHGTALPPCPLIFPLLNEKGKITPLGSFISLNAMEKATYLPKAVFQLSSEGSNFYAFGLFQKDSTYHDGYKKELPLLFETKDFAVGTLVQNKKGYKIHLKFWGTHPEKVFDKKFPMKGLYKAPVWMATCLHEWVGFHPTKAEADFLANPHYKTDDHLKRAASLENLIYEGGNVLVTRYEEILADNSDCPCLFPTWVGILEAKEGVSLLDMVKAELDQNVQSTCMNYEMIEKYYYAGKYDEAIKLALPMLKQDNRNRDWYGWAATSLEYKGFWKEGIQLFKNWSQMQPENPVVWYLLSYHMRGWGQPPSDADKVKYPDCVRLSQERLNEGLTYAKKATELSPEDARFWTELLYYGKYNLVGKKDMETYFKKSISLNPNDWTPYQTYLYYLKSMDSADYKESFAFARKYSKKFPTLVTDVIVSILYLPAERSLEDQKNRLRKMSATMKSTPYWKEYKKNMERFLSLTPGDVSEWKTYLQWADLVDEQDSVFQLAKKISRKDPELKALYPYVVLFYPTEALKNRITDQEKTSLWTNVSLVKQMGMAYRELEKLDPKNWHNLNQLASYDVNNGFKSEARKTFKKIGTHWASEVWTKEDFNKAKAKVN